MAEHINLARQMRGKVPEWNDDYIELRVPGSILDKMNTVNIWVDTDGFWWGYGYMFATKVKATKENVVVVAQKPLGQGCAVHKAVMANAEIKEFECKMLI